MKRTRKISAPLRFGLALFCMALVSVTVLGAELTILTWMGVDHVALYRELLDEFEAEHGVTVNIIRTGTSALWEKLDTMILAGTPPDVFFMSGEHLAKYHATGVLEPLDEWAARTGADLDDFFPPSLEQYRIDGKLYAIPYDFGNRVVVYNVDLFQEAGLAEPTKEWASAEWTNESLREAARKLFQTDSHGEVTRWGFVFPRSYRGIAPFIYSYGARFVLKTDDGFVTGLAEPEAIEALSFLQSMFREGDWGKHGGYAEVGNGTAAMAQFIPGNVMAMQTQYPDVNWDIAPWPRGPGGRWTSGGGTGWAMSSRSAHPELAWKLLEFLTSYEVQLKHMQSGLKAPGRQSVAFHPDFLGQAQPRSMQVFIDAWFHIVSDPPVSAWGDYWPVVLAAYRELEALEITPQEFALRMSTQGNAILRESVRP